ncbi:MAG: AmmeMemoRadiSam system protein B [Armatimonadota bacterium]
MPGASAQVREACLAGTWYAGSAHELREEIEDCFRHRLGPGELPPKASAATTPRSIIGLVSPHAGIRFSGPAAAHGYLELAKEGAPEVVVVVGPNHGRWSIQNATMADGVWTTPLGEARIHSDVARAILEACPFLSDSAAAHRDENSIEIQLPFLQHIFAEHLSWVPIMMADQSAQTSERLGEALAGVLSERDAVIVASTDLSHESNQFVVKRNDPQVIERILSLDPVGLNRVRERHRVSMCGYGPVMAMLTAAKALGAVSARQLAYYTSADMAPGGGYIDGYLSAAVHR